MKKLIVLIALLIIASPSSAQQERIAKGEYYMLRKDIHDKIERDVTRLDSLLCIDTPSIRSGNPKSMGKPSDLHLFVFELPAGCG